MKIIEALKELPVLEKRIEKNAALIQSYSSAADHGEESLLRWIASDGTRYHESGIVAGNMLPHDRLFRPTGKDIMQESKTNA